MDTITDKSPTAPRPEPGSAHVDSMLNRPKADSERRAPSGYSDGAELARESPDSLHDDAQELYSPDGISRTSARANSRISFTGQLPKQDYLSSFEEQGNVVGFFNILLRVYSRRHTKRPTANPEKPLKKTETSQ